MSVTLNVTLSRRGRGELLRPTWVCRSTKSLCQGLGIPQTLSYSPRLGVENRLLNKFRR